MARVLLVSALASITLVNGASIDRTGYHAVNFTLFARQNQQSCLNSNLIQSASALTGQEPGTDGIKPGQAASKTDKNNFINFCNGQEITNGKQITTGSCNGIPMGKIPAVSNMISAMITNPQPGDKIQSDTTFNVSVQTTHLKAGNFVNPTTNYYTAPQDLDGNGDIIGHCHVTVQDIGSLKSTTPPDPSKFAFFKGIDDAGNGRGLLQAVVDGGLPPGVYRVCTMIAAQNHQPVSMPVAQRGAQDDCTKFEVVAKAGSNGASTSKNQKDGDMTKNQDQEGFVQAGKGKGGKNTAGGNNGGAANSGANAGGNTGGNAGANAGQDNAGAGNSTAGAGGNTNNTGNQNGGKKNTGKGQAGAGKFNGKGKGGAAGGQFKGNAGARKQRQRGAVRQ